MSQKPTYEELVQRLAELEARQQPQLIARLRRREEEYRALAEHSPDVMARFDRNCRGLYVNPAGARVVALSPDQFIGKTLYEIGLPEAHARVWEERIRKVIETGQPMDVEDAMASPDGARQFIYHIVPERAADGAVVMAMVVGRDITDRKQAEEELRVAEERLRQAVRVAGLGTFEHDHLTNDIRMSPRMREIYGFDPQETVTIDAVLQSVPPEDRPWLAEAIARAHDTAGEGLYGVEHRVVRRDAGIRWVISRSQTVFQPINGARRPVQTIGAVMDITERKMAEQSLQKAHDKLEEQVKERTAELRQSEEKYRALAERVNDIIYSMDTEGRLTYVGPQVERYGFRAREMIGQVFLDLISPLDREHMAAEAARSMSTGEEFPSEFRVQVDGREFWFEERGKVQRDAQGRVTGIYGILRDITDRKRSEEMLKTANLALEHRTVELRALAVKLTHAEQRERERMAGLLHDHLQQLLVAAKLNVAVLMQDLSKESLRQPARKASAALDQAIQEAKSLTVELSPPILRDAGLSQGLKWLGRQMRERYGLVVKIDVDEDILVSDETARLVLFDATREILFNVVKHAGTKSAQLQMRRLEDQVMIVLSDEGAGFDPTVTTPHEGLAGGFGLFSLRERLEAMGGCVEIDSAPGQGTCVMLLLPLAVTVTAARTPSTPAADEPAAVQSLPASNQAATAAGRKIRVMLVDDHQMLRQGLIQLIAPEPDITVVGEAAGGRKAVELVRQLQPDLVIMDISMPDMNGIEATRAIQAELPGVRVIGLSMHEEADQAEAMLKAGAVAYVTKSHAAETLVAAIRQSFEKTL